MIYDTFDEAEIERSMMQRKTGHKWGIQKVSHKGPHDRYSREMYQTFIISKKAKRNPRQKQQHWIATVTQLANNRVDQTAYYDGVQAAATRYFKSLPAINRYWGRAGYTITMQPNAIVLWDGYNSNPALRKKGNTLVTKGPGNEITVRLHDTDIVKVLADGTIELNSGGWRTPTTKRRMNEAADELKLGFSVYAKKGEWFVESYEVGIVPFSDGMIFPAVKLRNPKRKKTMARKKKRSAKQLANDRRLGRMAKARAKAKRGGRRKVTRKKNTHRRVARKKTTRRNPRRTALKKSHLFLLFKCNGRTIQFYFVSAAPNNWTGDKGKAILFKTKEQAAKLGRHFAKKAGYKRYSIGVAPSDMTSAKILADCKQQMFLSGK